jgi:hypothetical protein
MYYQWLDLEPSKRKGKTMDTNATTTNASEAKARRAQAKRLLADHLHPDTIGVNKAGNLLLRWGFFCTLGRTAEGYAQTVGKVLFQHGVAHTIVDSGQVWKLFHGGASVAHQSHFYVEGAIG